MRELVAPWPGRALRALAPAVLLATAAACERDTHSTVAAGSVVLPPAPPDSAIPPGALGASVRRGRALLAATGDSLPAHVGNGLRCTSCHLDDGHRPYAAPWIGIYARFPQYRSRSGTVQVIEDRVNDCFRRSLNGRALDPAGRDIRDIVAYFAFISRGTPVGAPVTGQGFARLQPLKGDTASGRHIFAGSCARCHGVDGAGTSTAPAVWGSRSYSIGAGMARVRTAAAFIRRNMPLDRPATLTDQEAFDVAAYINSRPRPDFPGKERDWPNGDPPPDVAYSTAAAGSARNAAAGTGPAGRP